MQFKELNPLQKALIISIGFHVLVAVLAVFIQAGIQLPNHSFAEMGFIVETSPDPVPVPESSTQESAAAAVQTNPNPAEQPVDLPKRRMLEEEPAQIQQQGSQKLTPQNQTTSPMTATDNRSQTKAQPQIPLSEQKSTRPANSTPSQMLNNPGSTIAGSGVTARPFFIQGDAADRTIVQQVLPEYPAELQREARIQLKFTVYPDGRVGRIIPIKKAGPVLEERSIRALKQWRFDQLSPSQPQKEVTGIITFVFKLQ